MAFNDKYIYHYRAFSPNSMILRRSLLAAASLVMLLSATSVSAYYIEDVTSGYTIPKKVMPILLEEEPWPSWIGRLDDTSRAQLPLRIVKTGGESEGEFFSDEWPSWIGRVE